MSSLTQYKLVILGAGGVGKSSLVDVFLQRKFRDQHEPTVGDCHKHTMEALDGSRLFVDVLDTAGSYDFPAMRQLSISSGHAFMLVFAVDNLESFQHVDWLHQEIRRLRGEEVVPLLLVGTKTDSLQHQVSRDAALQMATCTLGCRYVETSASTDPGSVRSAFCTLYSLTAGSRQQCGMDGAEHPSVKARRQMFRRWRSFSVSRASDDRPVRCGSPGGSLSLPAGGAVRGCPGEQSPQMTPPAPRGPLPNVHLLVRRQSDNSILVTLRDRQRPPRASRMSSTDSFENGSDSSSEECCDHGGKTTPPAAHRRRLTVDHTAHTWRKCHMM